MVIFKFKWLKINKKLCEDLQYMSFSSWLGYVTVADMLLNKGWDANAKDNNGDTALHLAAREGNLQEISIEASNLIVFSSPRSGEYDFVLMLTMHGVDVNIPNESGATALHIAAAMSMFSIRDEWVISTKLN